MRECSQWKASGQCSKDTHAVSVAGPIVDRKDNRLILLQKRRHRLTERNHQKVQTSEEKVLMEQETELCADISLGESVRIRGENIGTLPLCHNYKSESGSTYGEKCRFRHVETDGQFAKSQSGGKRISCPE